jgi:hypothetical protein
MWVTGCVTTCILNLGARLRRLVRIMLVILSMRKESEIRTEYKASWVAKQVTMLWRKEDLFVY